jgi:hypothetical protein
MPVVQRRDTDRVDPVESCCVEQRIAMLRWTNMNAIPRSSMGSARQHRARKRTSEMRHHGI